MRELVLAAATALMPFDTHLTCTSDAIAALQWNTFRYELRAVGRPLVYDVKLNAAGGSLNLRGSEGWLPCLRPGEDSVTCAIEGWQVRIDLDSMRFLDVYSGVFADAPGDSTPVMAAGTCITD